MDGLDSIICRCCYYGFYCKRFQIAEHAVDGVDRIFDRWYEYLHYEHCISLDDTKKN
ncbi:hypothetical protein PMI05_02816 [Brevibacillus sp. BC25]|nr:hypothetical protein PMI05_02816 [Brevibacillus sp. BC25]